VSAILDIPGIPVYCNVLWATQRQAQAAPTGDLRLGFCTDCGHAFNLVFDPTLVDYTVEYENSLHYSGRFQQYAEALARDLVARHDLYGKDIVEIACGKGDFLHLLSRLGDNRGVGFDPSYDATRTDETRGTPNADETGTPPVTFVAEYYGPDHAHYPADLICCRHALEHLPAPTAFLTELRRVVGERRDTTVFFEVPNALYSLRDHGIWDFIYEHPSYFGETSLRRCFELAGFRVNDVRESFGGQFLRLEAVADPEWSAGQRTPTAGTDLNELTGYAGALGEAFAGLVDHWRRRLAEATDDGRTLVLWGGGSKGVTFLNLLRPGPAVAGIVDINPHKQGKFVPGTGHLVLQPASLPELRPDEVVVMNPLYVDEIAATLADLGLDASIVTV